MPPKKGKKGKGTVIDGVDTATMNREQLEAFAIRLKNEMDREREERNFFQLERDKLRTFWEITRNQLEEARAALRNKDREVEISQEQADCEVKHAVQQMKHLQYENMTKIGEIHAEAMTQLKIAQEDYSAQEEELLRDKRELKRLLREREEQAELQIQQIKMDFSRILSEERQRFEAEANDMIYLHDQKLSAQREEVNIKQRMEIFEIEERKNNQISKLIELHDKAFNDMKNYYNDITLNNLALISSLKEQMEELRKQSEQAERIATEKIAENKKLAEPLKVAQDELVDLRRKLQYYDRDRLQLVRLKSRLESSDKELQALKWETETLLMRNKLLIDERDGLKGKFEEAVLELQQKTGLTNVLLEKKIEVLESEAEKRTVELNEALHASGVDPEGLHMRIERLLQSKNILIDDLRYELARVCKAHNDLLASYEAKLIQFGVPLSELGFEPLRANIKGKIGTGPAGLITKNR